MITRTWRVLKAVFPRPNEICLLIAIFMYGVCGWWGVLGWMSFKLFMFAMNLKFDEELRKRLGDKARRAWNDEPNDPPVD